MVGNVPVGGGAPVTVQTMTNTVTADVKATIDQIRRCEEAGADIVRVSCPDAASTAALKQIVRAVLGYQPKISVEEGVARFVDWYREYYGV